MCYVLSRVRLLVTPWTVACHGIFQARILEQLSCPTSGYLPKPGIEPVSFASPVLAGGFFTTAPPGKPVSVKKPWLLLLLSAVTSGDALCSCLTNPTSLVQALLIIKSKHLPIPRLPFLNFKDLIPAHAAAAAAKSLQSCSTLCDPINVSPPGSPVPGILQARTLEWVAISFSNA